MNDIVDSITRGLEQAISHANGAENGTKLHTRNSPQRPYNPETRDSSYTKLIARDKPDAGKQPTP